MPSHSMSLPSACAAPAASDSARTPRPALTAFRVRMCIRFTSILKLLAGLQVCGHWRHRAQVVEALDADVGPLPEERLEVGEVRDAVRNLHAADRKSVV